MMTQEANKQVKKPATKQTTTTTNTEKKPPVRKTKDNWVPYDDSGFIKQN